MPSLSYGISAFDRDKGQLPELKCINLYAEGARTSEGQITLQSREGLATVATNGASAITAIFSEKGAFAGDYFTISGTGTSPTLFRNTASQGALTTVGTGARSLAASQTELLIAGGSTLNRYTGSTGITTPVFPDSASVRAVCIINFLFVAIRGDGTFPGRIYWSAVNNGNSWDALDYMTAERVPDDALDILALNDNIWVFGQSSVEIMQTTGNADAPFRRIPQVAFGVGVIDTGCAIKADNSVFWIGSDGVVYRATDGNPVAVSEPWLNAKIRAATSWKMFSYRRDGEEFVVVRLNGTSGTSWALPVSTQKEWCEFQTNGGQWIVSCATMQGTIPYFGHQSTGAVMNFSGWQDLGVAIDRTFTAATQLNDPLIVHNLRYWLNVGQAPAGVTPTLYMSYSTDGGNTYGSEVSTDIGNAADDGTADYRVMPEFRALGMFDFPGAMFKTRYSAAGDFRVSAVKVNETGGGRSRA